MDKNEILMEYKRIEESIDKYGVMFLEESNKDVKYLYDAMGSLLEDQRDAIEELAEIKLVDLESNVSDPIIFSQEVDGDYVTRLRGNLSTLLASLRIIINDIADEIEIEYTDVLNILSE